MEFQLAVYELGVQHSHIILHLVIQQILLKLILNSSDVLVVLDEHAFLAGDQLIFIRFQAKESSHATIVTDFTIAEVWRRRGNVGRAQRPAQVIDVIVTWNGGSKLYLLIC